MIDFGENDIKIIDYDSMIYLDPAKRNFNIKGCTPSNSTAKHLEYFVNREKVDRDHLFRETRHQIIDVCQYLADVY